MTAVRAIYENGVFRPLEPVDLPEASEVLVTPARSQPLPPTNPADMAEVYDILGRRYHTGEHDVAERHNEHQP
jgi:predicted DNA-binding antitoxin AbrB/MazE fold protein